MKCSMTLGNATVRDHEVDKWPENPLETINAYLKETHPDVVVWITEKSQVSETEAKMTWRRPDKSLRNPVGEPCAVFTVFEE